MSNFSAGKADFHDMIRIVQILLFSVNWLYSPASPAHSRSSNRYVCVCFHMYMRMSVDIHVYTEERERHLCRCVCGYVCGLDHLRLKRAERIG